jgi:metal-responsive CopG/Arc/MetJ family transcriptional regulator
MGRPKLPVPVKNIMIRFPTDLLPQLDRVVAKMETSRSKVVLDLLLAALASVDPEATFEAE